MRSGRGVGKGGFGGQGREFGGKGGGGKGGGKGGKPFWRQFVDASDDPEVIVWCQARLEAFLSSGRESAPVERLPHAHRNTIRSMAPQMGCAWRRAAKGEYELVRAAPVADASVLKREVVEAVRRLCEASGGKCAASRAWRELAAPLQAQVQASLRLTNLKSLPEACKAECEAAGLRVNPRGNAFLLDGVDDEDDAWFVGFGGRALSDARRALETALAALPPAGPPTAGTHGGGLSFLRGPPPAADSGPYAALLANAQSAGYARMLPVRSRLPAYAFGPHVCAAVRASQVCLVLGATGCGKTTQIPQLILEAEVQAGRPCRILASQPRRLSASSVAQRVAAERGSPLGAGVGYKVRFEEAVSDDTLLLFCTVGILLKAMQGNPALDGATHVIVDEVHERDLHTDFLLSLLRGAARARPELRIVLMSATVDPSAFRAYFPGAAEVSIPGRTNYTIEELFLEDFLPELPPAAPPSRPRAPSAFADGPLPGVPLDVAGVSAALPALSPGVAAQLAAAHRATADEVDLDLLVRVVLHVHDGAREGAVLAFVPGWAEIAETVKRLEASPAAPGLSVLPLHSRMPTAEQRDIFEPPPAGKRKVVVATILAETSITIEDVVFVVDTGRTKTTSVSASSLVPALRTGWYARANGTQRRGRAGRCRPGVWFRLYSSLQWAALPEHATPEMLRAPLEELCLEIGALGLGAPEAFLSTAISTPPADAVRRAVAMLHRLGATTDCRGSSLTPLGHKLAALRVHPTLGKMLLLAGLFRCYGPTLTIAAALGYRSPFLCPLGREREADACKRQLAAGSDSDHVALANAYDGWLHGGRARFATANFLSHQTLGYVHRLRSELADATRDALDGPPPTDHAAPGYLADVSRACLVAGLLPNVAWLRRWGKGETMGGLQVVAHPGSVNSRAAGALVVFYGESSGWGSATAAA